MKTAINLGVSSMSSSLISIPDLRIIPSSYPLPHEEHDSQRSLPLMHTLKTTSVFTNPPILTVTPQDQYIILDGANRCYSFQALQLPFILVQIVHYGQNVSLGNWNHALSDWNLSTFLASLKTLQNLDVIDARLDEGLGWIHTKDGKTYTIVAQHTVHTVAERNQTLREVVRLYQQNSTLSRTASSKPDDVWQAFPSAFAFVTFENYHPHDIVDAAINRAFLPPGISRHVVQGRVLQLNYPMDILRHDDGHIEEKNQQLQSWMVDRFKNRSVRFYAESTYHFNE